MRTVLRSLLKIFLAILLILILVVGAYVAYVFSTYYRVEDNQELYATKAANVESSKKPLQVGEDAKYKVTSWNIGFGAYTDDYSFFMDGGEYSRAISEERLHENLASITQELTALKSDFYFIQEVDIDSTRSYGVDERDAIVNTLDADERYSWTFALNYDSPYLFYPLSLPHGKSKSGMLTFSKTNISSAIRRSLPIEEGLSKLLDCDRCYAINRIPTDDGKELLLVNIHLSAYTTDGTIAEKQLEMLTAELKAEYDAGNYIVCGGDFNKDLLGNSAEIFGVSGEAYNWAQPIPGEAIPEGLKIVAPLDKESPISSCRNADSPWNKETNFQVTVDGFIVSDNVKVSSSKVVNQDFKYSDHQPVEIVFTLVGSE